MRSPFRYLSGVLFAVALLPAAARAQTNHMHLGGRLGYDATNRNAVIGAQFSAPLSRHLEFYPSADFNIVDAGTSVTFNFDLKYRMQADRPMWWYIGTGLAADYFSIGGRSDTFTGINAFGGIEPLQGKLHPFVEVRALINDDTKVGVYVGFNVTLGEGRN